MIGPKNNFIVRCGNRFILLTNLYKCFLKFKENVSKYGRTIGNNKELVPNFFDKEKYEIH